MKFHHFKSGLPMGDFTIQKWCRECIDSAKAGNKHNSISSGDTMVSFHVFGEYFYLFIANSSGYSKISCMLEEIDQIDWRYERPTDETTDRYKW